MMLFDFKKWSFDSLWRKIWNHVLAGNVGKTTKVGTFDAAAAQIIFSPNQYFFLFDEHINEVSEYGFKSKINHRTFEKKVFKYWTKSILRKFNLASSIHGYFQKRNIPPIYNFNSAYNKHIIIKITKKVSLKNSLRKFGYCYLKVDPYLCDF